MKVILAEISSGSQWTLIFAHKVRTLLKHTKDEFHLMLNVNENFFFKVIHKVSRLLEHS